MFVYYQRLASKSLVKSLNCHIRVCGRESKSSYGFLCRAFQQGVQIISSLLSVRQLSISVDGRLKRLPEPSLLGDVATEGAKLKLG